MVGTSISQSENLLLQQMVEIIVATVAPDKVILFGSRAKGMARADSDYDLLIVDPEPFTITHSRRKTAGKLYRALAKLEVSCDLVMCNDSEVEKWRHGKNHVIARAVNEGKVIYDTLSGGMSLPMDGALNNYTSIAFSETPLLPDMVKVIVEVAKPDKVILFGSRAKGTARADSDYDFMIIKETAFFETHSRRETSGKLRRALAKFRVSKDILMYSAEEIEQRRNWRNSVVFCALNEGKVLYERS
jgi:uncharacterized protein